MEYIFAKTILIRTKSTSWFGYRYNMNLYKGCCHGCIYCDSRSECYGVTEFDRVRAKDNALQILRDELRRKVQTGVVGTGAMSDPYNPFEKELCLTRHSLELLDAYGFGVGIATKSNLIARDADILTEIATHSPVMCKITITTHDDTLCEKIEPHVARSSTRFEVLGQLAEKGLFTGILLMPVLPFLEDSVQNIREIVRRAKQANVRFIYPAFGMTLRQNQREWYFQKLESCFPGQNLRERYQKAYGNRYECPSPNAAELWRVFTHDCEQAGILYRMQDIIRANHLGYKPEQPNFFT